jgi:hypothetical protein
LSLHGTGGNADLAAHPAVTISDPRLDEQALYGIRPGDVVAVDEVADRRARRARSLGSIQALPRLNDPGICTRRRSGVEGAQIKSHRTMEVGVHS